MLPGRSAKPWVSMLLAILFVLTLNLPFLSTAYLAGPTTPFDVVQAGAIHWGFVITAAAIWLGVQLFWSAPAEATKLGLAASATIVWLCLLFFFNFHQTFQEVESGAGDKGAVAFFALMGGLGVVLLWTRFFADEITF